MSIRPRFTTALFDGSKRVEFRRRPLAADVSAVLVYETAPLSALVGWFTVTGQVRSSPQELWDRFEPVAGIDCDGLFDYLSGASVPTAIQVGAMFRFSSPVSLRAVLAHGRAPQGVCYLDAADPVLSTMFATSVPVEFH